MAAPIKKRDAIRKLQALGFSYDRPGRGSHEIWKGHGVSVTLAFHKDECSAGVWRQVEKDAKAAKEAADRKAAEETAKKATQGIAKAGGKGAQSQQQAAHRHGTGEKGKKRGRGRG